MLASCYRKCFELVDELKVRSVTFPAISTGVYGYPLQEAAAIATGEVVRLLDRVEGAVWQAIFVLYDQAAYDTHARALGDLSGGSYG